MSLSLFKLDLGCTIGAYEGGVMVALFMYGITTVQAYSVLRGFPKDLKRLKYFVVAVWLLEGVHSAQLAYSLYGITVLGFGQPDVLLNPLKKLSLASVTAGVTTASIQGFFAYRVHKITRTYATSFICTFLAIASLVGHIVLAITGFEAANVFVWQLKWRPVLAATLAASAAADMLIAANLCWGLWNRNREAFRGGAHMLVDQVIAWSIETCLLTTVCTILMLILFLTMESFVWLAVSFNISRLFSNAFLASLNGRKVLRKQLASQAKFVMPQFRLGTDGVPTSTEIKFDIKPAGDDVESRLVQTFKDESTGSLSSRPFPRSSSSSLPPDYYQRRRTFEL